MNSIEVVHQPLVLPFADGIRVPAGFASPADDFLVKRLDVGELLHMQHPATFCMRASGHSMRQAGISDGDLLIFNRAITPRHGYVVLAQLDEGFTVKYLHSAGGEVKLVAANPDYPDIVPRPGQILEIQGVLLGALTLFPPARLK